MDIELNNDLVQLVQLHFEPAADAADASAKMTTAEFFRLIERHAPGVFYASQMQPVLMHLQYRTKLIGEDIMWLARAR